MSWARIMAPLSGGKGDRAAVEAAVTLAPPFGAEVEGVYTPADVADVMPWMGEGFLGGVQTTALESLKEAAAVGEKSAREALEAVGYAKARFVSLQTPVWAGGAGGGRRARAAWPMWWCSATIPPGGAGRWPSPFSRWSRTSSGRW